MKLLTLVYLSVHGYSVVFTGDQCRALRQAQIGVAQCHDRFASQRAVSASLSGPTPNTATAPGSTNTGETPGRSPGSPSQGAGSPGSPGAASPGAPSHGTPGNPGGGDVRPGQPSPPLPTVLPEKPPVSLAGIGKLRGELRERVRDRIIHGAKPPPSQPGKPGLGPGGLRGQASPKSSSGAAWAGQAR